jgi:hypothetical protein
MATFGRRWSHPKPKEHTDQNPGTREVIIDNKHRPTRELRVIC